MCQWPMGQHSVQFSRVWLFATPWIAARQASLSISNSQSLLKLMPIESVMPSSHLILCRTLLLLPIPPPASDAEAETPIFWPPQVKSLLIGKDPDAGQN